LTDISGIGQARAEQLREAGFDSIGKLVIASPEAIATVLKNVSLETATKIINEAKKALPIPMKA